MKFIIFLLIFLLNINLAFAKNFNDFLLSRPIYDFLDLEELAHENASLCKKSDAYKEIVEKLKLVFGLDLTMCESADDLAYAMYPNYIFVSEKLNEYTLCEKSFVLAHEAVHLYYLHEIEILQAVNYLAKIKTKSVMDAKYALSYDLGLLI